ncbi:Uncharacterized conserved protein, DUF362 family [Desulfatibacillum alkenivorans DSM 16219]|jgi:uncharacterized protein (DUF362 family)/Pyruvate/2-oxoacid:ferredoxin oxidoreductase delta subunit|uniref:Uncharacterized conserved protein, DUF362 family n=1 Tax=Desulfatibacillum alkenivorans DSM 16219 TaxID=1121393 RepID=A0A1M6PTI2_9BACT|nr:DUF362 domain-containing protein [Desulfatibacillum alkenivorans]SHK11304.1 Uncharacterized conserved protein, DUF362 family [Desulfatibacillum alkenivorans DSM 16219]
MTQVALMRCKEYDFEVLKDVVARGMTAAGFDLSSLNGLRVALKPNLLMPSNPDKCIVTHPVFFQTVASIVKDYGGHPVLIENPNFFSLENTLKKAGYGPIVEELGIEVADPVPTRPLHWEHAKLYRTIDISAVYFEADVILSLVKFKTHSYSYITGAVKHWFGTIPGLKKSRMHMRVPDQMDFADYLLDLYGGLKYGLGDGRKIFHIVDGVRSMEGEGPGPTGSPRDWGVVIAGEDAIAVDWVAVKTAGLDADKAYTLVQGFKRDFGPNSPEDIQVLGESIQDLACRFTPPKNTVYGGVVWPLTSKTVKNWLVEKPAPNPEKCVLCYQCMKTCPAEAISKPREGKKTPDFDYRKCIRCFCCMEICPEAAIGLKKGALQWLFSFK